MITEKLNGGKVFESAEDGFPVLTDHFAKVEDDKEEEECGPNGVAEISPEEVHVHGEESHDVESRDEESHDEVREEENDNLYEISGYKDSELSQSIDKLIEEAKKRKVSETSDLNFLKFLSKSQVDSYYALTNEEQDAVKLHINERSYFTQKEVLTLISEALSTKTESLEERVIRMMPENTKAIWNQLNESAKKSVLSQARLYPEEMLMTESQIEHFWETRNLKKNESTKKLVSHEDIIQEDKLSDNEMTAIMERFKNV